MAFDPTSGRTILFGGREAEARNGQVHSEASNAPFPDNLTRGLRHVLGVSAEKLHADWSLDLVKVEILTGAFITPENSFSGNELSCQDIRAVFLA